MHWLHSKFRESGAVDREHREHWRGIWVGVEILTKSTLRRPRVDCFAKWSSHIMIIANSPLNSPHVTQTKLSPQGFAKKIYKKKINAIIAYWPIFLTMQVRRAALSGGGAVQGNGPGSVCRLRMRERCLHLIRRRHLRGDGTEVPVAVSVPVAFAVGVAVAVSIADVAINQQISERGKQGGKWGVKTSNKTAEKHKKEARKRCFLS